MSRREALRRLGLLGLSGAAAASLLAAAVVEQAKALRGAIALANRRRRSSRSPRCQTREITFRGPRGRRLMGAWAAARRRSRRRAGDPREPRAQRLDSCDRGSPRGERLLVAGDRPALGGGRHRVVRGRVRGDGRARSGSSVALRRRHEGGRDGASPPAPGQEGRGDRLLLRRRYDVAPARVEGAPPGGRGPLLRPVPGGRESRRAARAAVLGIYAELDSRVNASRAPRARGAAQGRPDGTRSSPSPASTTRSSTRPAPATTARRPRPPTAGCWPGSAPTWPPDLT